MTKEEEKARMREYLAGWQRASKRLSELRDEEIRSTDTATATAQLRSAFESANQGREMRSSSGLVAFYRILSEAKNG